MLQFNKRSLTAHLDDARSDLVNPSDALQSYLAIFKRQQPLIALIVACTVTLGLVYLFTTPPQYTATTTMVIDTRKVQLFQQQSILGDIAIDPGTVETQIEILRSEKVSLSVIKDLRLTEDPEFVSRGGGIVGATIGFISSLFQSEEAASEFELTRQALGVFEGARTIKRLGLTYVMEISFRSLDSEKAARIANAIADAYVLDQLEAKYQTTRRAGKWLQDRIKELRSQATIAERAVVDYKDKNNIVNTGGRLMSDQQLAELNTQTVTAQAALAEAKARLERITNIMHEDVPDASVTDALKNDVIVRLRSQYLDLAARQADLSARYGADHLAPTTLRNQMLELRRSIRNEIGRIAESYRSDYEIALTRAESVKQSLRDIVSESQITGQAQLGLRELESNAQTYRAMYDTFLQRYMETVQQQSFPITEARVIGEASRPLSKSHPKPKFVMAGAIAGGLLLGFAIAMFRELSDNSFRTGAQIESLLQTNCLAVLPSLGSRALRKAKRVADAAPPPTGPRPIARNSNLLCYVVDSPFSRFTEAVRALKVATNLVHQVDGNRVIGVTSSVPNEGKSTIASNFAQLLAHGGSRVMLVDSDLRNPSLSRIMAPDARSGLIDVLNGKIELADAIWTDPVTKMSFLSAGETSKLMHTSDIIGSDRMKKLFDELRKACDYVIVDLSPLAPIVDVRMTTTFIDSYVYVVEWGRTTREVVEHNLLGAREIYDKLLGIVLNKADVQMLGRYDGHYSGNYSSKHYGRYGYVE